MSNREPECQFKSQLIKLLSVSSLYKMGLMTVTTSQDGHENSLLISLWTNFNTYWLLVIIIRIGYFSVAKPKCRKKHQAIHNFSGPAWPFSQHEKEFTHSLWFSPELQVNLSKAQVGKLQEGRLHRSLFNTRPVRTEWSQSVP